ncbi:hypothetical protein SNE40_022831 [Patella caerulea]|uniref:Next to BRCA1 gene 1 protein n=1 Tax=Patella caerulea TaxID=87958 RepID=A0AAN8FXC6_PATCE
MEEGTSDDMSDYVIVTARHLNRNDNDQPEPFRVEADILWPDFKAVVQAQFESPPSDVVIKYTDDDNEMVTMNTQDELFEAIKLARNSNGIIQLEVKAINEKEEKKKTLLQLQQELTDATLILPAIPKRKSPLLQRVKPDIAKSASSSSEASNDVAGPTDISETGETLPNSEQDIENGPVKRKVKIEKEENLETDNSVEDNLSDYEKMAGSNIPNSMPYPDFVEFMEKLKHELRSEIVHDVTKKTVKQVLRGLDGAPVNKPLRDPWSVNRDDIKHAHPIYLHEGIVCNNCQKTILGCRYKCGNCPDYDLCEKCESKYGVHNAEHVFLKLRRPCKESRDNRKSPLLKRVLYKSDIGDAFDRLGDKRQEKLKKKAEKLFEKEKRKEEKLKRKLEKYDGLKDSPMKRERYEKLPVPMHQHLHFCSKEYKLLGGSFVRDITIPDGTAVQPGTRMFKTWRLLNTGSTAWRDTSMLRLMYGTIPAVKTEVAVPHLKPGEEGDVTAELTAPEEPGRYQSHWKLFDRGLAFGHRVWVMINVVPRELLEPKPVEPLRVVEESKEEEVTKTEAPEDQTVVRDIETPVTRCDVPLYRLIPSMLDQVDDMEQQPAIVDTQPSPVNDLNKSDSKNEESFTKIECLNVDGSETDAVELNLNSAVAAMERLTVSDPVDVPTTSSNKDLLSFEFLDRTPPKVSQTATPNNTPLDVSPPKSPITTPRLETVLSASSSMELVNGENEECVPLLAEYPHERIQSLEFRPDILDDVESLDSYSDDDSSSSDDFFLVPLPDCFDTSKPLTKSILQDNNNTVKTEVEVELDGDETPLSQLTVDDMLQVSASVDTRPLTPEVTSPEIIRDVDQTEASSGENQESESVANTSDGAVGESPESQILDSSCYAAASGRPLTDAEHQTQVLQIDEGCSQAAERTEPTSSDSSQQGADASAIAAATAEQQEFAKQLLDVAVTAAANAASNAFCKVKDVFNTWQAKDMERKQNQQKVAQNIKVTKEWSPKPDTYKPPQSTWTPPKDTYVPPKSTWTLPEDSFTGKESSVTDSKREEATPMKRLIEMGFCNREVNQELLTRYEDDVNQVISVLIDMHKDDWAAERH